MNLRSISALFYWLTLEVRHSSIAYFLSDPHMSEIELAVLPLVHWSFYNSISKNWYQGGQTWWIKDAASRWQCYLVGCVFGLEQKAFYCLTLKASAGLDLQVAACEHVEYFWGLAIYLENKWLLGDMDDGLVPSLGNDIWTLTPLRLSVSAWEVTGVGGTGWLV